MAGMAENEQGNGGGVLPEIPNIDDYSESNPLVVTNKRGESFDVFPGGRYRLLSSGAVQDTESSLIVAVHPGGHSYLNREQAREASLSRWVKGRQAVLDQLGYVSGSNWMAAWGRIIESMYDLAILGKDAKNIMAAVAAAKFIGVAAGIYNERGGLDDRITEELAVNSLREAVKTLPPDRIRLLLRAFDGVSITEGGENGENDGNPG